MRNLMIVLLTHYCSVDKIKKNEMGVACVACGGEEKRGET
jgi:hypothetical protein